MSEVIQNESSRRFEMKLPDEQVAYISYVEEQPGVLTLTHTVVPEEHEGQGIGSKLVAGTLAQVEEKKLKIIVECSFVASYLKKNSEFERLVA